jgi:hypothetical protein
VTGDAGVLEDRTDVALEIESLRRGRKIGGNEAESGKDQRQENPDPSVSGIHGASVV